MTTVRGQPEFSLHDKFIARHHLQCNAHQRVLLARVDIFQKIKSLRLACPSKYSQYLLYLGQQQVLLASSFWVL